MEKTTTYIQDLQTIIKQCEESELYSFEYKNENISLSFHKRKWDSLVEENMDTYIMQESEVKMVDNHTNIVTDILQYKKDIDVQESEIAIMSPFVGTVEFSTKLKLNCEGVLVEKGEIICYVEAMKLLNDIKAPVTGKIKRILVEDNSFVEYNQQLLIIEVDKDD